MSIECGECEHDLRGGHAESCSRHPARKLIGRRFLIVGDHPHAGKVAECIDFQKVAFGEYRPRMRDDNGDEFFVMKSDNWRAVK